MTTTTIILAIGSLLVGVVGYFLRQLVSQLKDLNNSVNEIKTNIAVQAVKHDNLETRMEKVEHKLQIA